MIDPETIDWRHAVALRGCGEFDSAAQDYKASEMLLSAGVWVETGLPLAEAKRLMRATRVLNALSGKYR